MIRGVVFDMDGLLFDTERLALEGTLAAARAMGLPLTEPLYLRSIGCGSAETRAIYTEALGGDYDHDELDRLVHSYIDEAVLRAGMPVRAGVLELLAELARRGLPAAVATSSRRDVARFYLEQSGLGHHFVAVLTGDQVARSKPAPDLYLLACETLGLPPGDCLALEDSVNGILSAAAAGLIPIMVPDLLQPNGELRQLCHAVLPSLGEVIALLERGLFHGAAAMLP